jgi:ERCC4-type nuclease
VQVVVDTREFQSPLVRRLIEDGIRIKAQAMDTGDYRIGDDIIVERKTSADLAASIVDGRFFEQVERLGQSGRGLMLVEGTLDGAGKLSRNALAGAAASAFVEHGVGVVVVPDAASASDFLAALARRAAKGASAPRARAGRASGDPDASVRYLFEGVAGVGPVLADRLRARFGSMAGMCRATAEDLRAVAGVGRKRALEIHHALHASDASGVEADAAQGLALKAGDGAAG